MGRKVPQQKKKTDGDAKPAGERAGVPQPIDVDDDDDDKKEEPRFHNPYAARHESKKQGSKKQKTCGFSLSGCSFIPVRIARCHAPYFTTLTALLPLLLHRLLLSLMMIVLDTRNSGLRQPNV